MAKTKIGIIGAGSFGIALAWLLNNNGHTVTVWTRRPDQAERLTQAHGNPDKLPGVTLPDSVRFTSDPAEAVAEAAAVILVVPSVSIRETARLLQPHLPEGALVVDCAKGLEEDTLKPLSTVITEELSDRKARVVVLSGPSHAEEVGRGMPTAIVAASEDPDAARAVQTIFMNPVFRVYTSEDMRGVELGGALKNVIALAAGIADGLGYGDNTKAAMITRGIAEITRLGVAMGARMETFAGLTGIGDLIVTCASMHSRNRRAGILIGQGKTVAQAREEVGMVVEGINAARAAYQLAQKHQITMPIITEVYRILFEDKNPADAVAQLMVRDRKAE